MYIWKKNKHISILKNSNILIMPTINDLPTTIYVRDISEDTAEKFSEIKKDLQINSNSEVVKILFTKYLELKEEFEKVKTKNKSLEIEMSIKDDKLNLLKKAFKIFKNL